MENSHFEVLAQALNKANQNGVFNLNESAVVANSLEMVRRQVTSKADEGMLKPSPIEEARMKAKEANKKSTEPVKDEKASQDKAPN